MPEARAGLRAALRRRVADRSERTRDPPAAAPPVRVTLAAGSQGALQPEEVPSAATILVQRLARQGDHARDT